MSIVIYSLYKTTNLLNGKIYYGIHREGEWPKLDNYLGSGVALKQAIGKHGRENFKREILCISDNPEYVYFLESQIVNEEFIKETTNYNMCGGGVGPLIYSEEMRAKLRDANRGENNPNYGKSPSDETRVKLSRAKKGKNNPNYGKQARCWERNTPTKHLQR